MGNEGPPTCEFAKHPTLNTALSKPRWYALLMVVLSMIVLTGLSVGWTSYVDGQREQSEREADRRWCVLLVIVDDAYSDAPPTTETGRRLAEAYRQMLKAFDCVR